MKRLYFGLLTALSVLLISCGAPSGNALGVGSPDAPFVTMEFVSDLTASIHVTILSGDRKVLCYERILSGARKILKTVSLRELGNASVEVQYPFSGRPLMFALPSYPVDRFTLSDSEGTVKVYIASLCGNPIELRQIKH